MSVARQVSVCTGTKAQMMSQIACDAFLSRPSMLQERSSSDKGDPHSSVTIRSSDTLAFRAECRFSWRNALPAGLPRASSSRK